MQSMLWLYIVNLPTLDDVDNGFFNIIDHYYYHMYILYQPHLQNTELLNNFYIIVKLKEENNNYYYY